MPSCNFPFGNNNIGNCSCADCLRSEEYYKKYYETCNNCDNITYRIISILRNRKGYEENYKISYCVDHYNKYLESEEKRRVEEETIKKIKDDKLNEFIESSKNLNVILKPIGLLDEYIIPSIIKKRYKRYGCIELDKNIFDIQKIKNRWYIDSNKLKLFFDQNMEEYFYIEDPRKHKDYL